MSVPVTSFVRGGLLWVREHPVAGWILLAACSVIAIFPHQSVQDLFAGFAARIGLAHLYAVMAAVTLAGGAYLSIIVVRNVRSQSQRRLLALRWVATLALIAATWNLLTVNNVELVHYPQYLLPGMLLFALTASPAESLAWVTVIGGLDECFQYWHLHGGWGVPYDFNDIYMDLLGGALGVMVAISFLDIGASRRPHAGTLLKRPGILLIAGIVLAGIALWAGGWMLLYEDKQNTRYWFALSRLRPKSFWFFDKTWGPRTIHTLSPVEGPALIIATLAFYSVLDFLVSFRPASKSAAQTAR